LYKKKNIAIIGFGYWGKKIFKYLKKKRGINIKFIYTRKKINLKNNTQSLNKIKKDKSIDKVFLITPINTHYKLANYFNNKTLFIEKPLTLEYKNSLKILKRKNIFVDYLYRYSKAINEIKKISDSKNLGKLINININISQTGRFNKFDINYLLNSHALSILSIFINIKNLNYNISSNLFNHKKLTDMNLNFKSKNIKGSIFLSLNSIYKKFNLLFIFQKGAVEYLKIGKFSKLKISKFNRSEKINIKSREYFIDENNNLDKSIDIFLSKKFNNFKKENIIISYILEKIEKKIYKKKKFFDKK
tara:strand:- start:1476 stop:2384 length:909 start_codon:yes stop_codon:yes gene_type:complete